MISYTNNPNNINRKDYRDMCLLSIQTDPFALSEHPEKYKTYTQKDWEIKVSQYTWKVIFVWLNKNKIVGMIRAKNKNINGFLSMLYVDPLYRGKWIAKQLIKYAIHYLENNWCSKIYLRVYKWQKAAIILYEKLWFIEIEKNIWEKLYEPFKSKNKRYFIKYL